MALELENKQKDHQQAFSQNEIIVARLYAAMPSEAQKIAFEQTPGKRRIILSTNIAETAVTIPGVQFVVDCGLAKIKLFDSHKGIETLALLPISKAAAEQRAGRAGRTAPGNCYRLYTEDTFSQLEEFNIPVN